MNAFPRPPIESMRPVVSFAVVRLLLPAAALLADLVLGVPNGVAPALILGLVAIPWAVAILMVARSDPARALTPAVAVGDLIVIAAVQAAMPDAYAATHFVALLFIGAHAHFQGARRGLLIAVFGAVLLIGVTIASDPPIESDQLAFYETIFAVSCLAIAAVIGELRVIETAGRLRAQALSRRTIVGEDEVRRHVADFIHDGPVQELIGLDLILRGASKAAERGDTARTNELIGQARELAGGNIRALRDEIVNLGPYAFEELSFEIAIERCIPVWHRRYGCEVLVDADLQLEPQVANDLFRITQEAVANGCKHGEAKHVEIQLVRDGQAAVLSVVDDGKGFGQIDPLGPHEPGHIGLASIRERTELLAGSLMITSQPGRTEVQVRVPLGGTRRRNRR
ncbi:MAG TPA: ATP-binding protein [Thermoleophilaceae bacterium]|nr:ATP-binding protein [Thermoleophilaceae bacterium]